MLKFVLSDTHESEVRALIGAPLREFNMRAMGPNNFKPLCIALEDAHSEVVGGLWGHTACGWLFTELLVVPEPSRGGGVGTQLMRMAETEAVQRGCHSAWLDTHEFQAKGFYEKLGYTEFGRLENYPTGYTRLFSRSSSPALSPTSPDQNAFDAVCGTARSDDTTY